jgi:hypothetical protein
VRIGAGSLAATAAATLVVAAAAGAAPDTVTISANHAIADETPLLLRGAVSSGRPGETVTIEQDDCGPIPWHPLRQVRTGDGGGWVSFASGEQNFRLRARWHGAVSRVIAIGVRPSLSLYGTRAAVRVLIRAYDWFPGKTAELQALHGGRWQTVARATLAKRPAAGQYAQTVGTFTKKIPHGVYRAVLPSRAAAPCYLAGSSEAVRY